MQPSVGKKETSTFRNFEVIHVFCTFYRSPGSYWALEQAKFNLVNNYFLVGVTEEMENFVNLLELSLPR